jgi:nucleoside 2-deoxyribosyltransferase
VNNKKIYIAGPLFTFGERWYLEQIDQVCRELGYETYLPHRDAGLATSAEEVRRYCFEQDKSVLDNVSLVVAVINGVDVDSGTAWEIGYAHARGTPIIGIFDDKRLTNPSAQVNPMVYFSIDLCNTIESLQAKLATYR